MMMMMMMMMMTMMSALMMIMMMMMMMRMITALIAVSDANGINHSLMTTVDMLNQRGIQLHNGSLPFSS